jgi:membrane associated rhomboid family serine protease
MFILPIRTNIWPRRTPYANYALILANIVIFAITYGPHYHLVGGQVLKVEIRHWAEQYMLYPSAGIWYQFITYAFLHGGFFHVGFNMFFLYLFGNNVSDKLGTVKYLIFYFAGAVLSALGHIMLGKLYGSASIAHNMPLVGASGAVSAVIGVYLVFYPQTLITVFYWFFFFGTLEIPAIYFIAFKLIFIDNIISRLTPNVAYDAHLAGYAFGIAAGLILLATGVVSVSGFDLWSMIKQWNRRRRYRDSVAGGLDPFAGRRPAKQVKVKEVKKTAAQQEKEGKITNIRSEISSRMAQRNFAAAAELYLQLNELDSDQLLSRQYLLDVANQLATEARYEDTAQAYEKFIRHYGNYEYIEQVELMLGLIYSRYLQQTEAAVHYLKEAEKKLTDPGQLKMCRDELKKL